MRIFRPSAWWARAIALSSALLPVPAWPSTTTQCDASAIRLACAFLSEQSEERHVQRHYLSLESMALILEARRDAENSLEKHPKEVAAPNGELRSERLRRRASIHHYD